MDKHVIAILLSFTLYAMYVFLPIIPALVLYRMFPDSQISASGVLSKFKFNATGAFGGYVITVVLGWGLVNSIHELIAKSTNPSWTIKTKLSIYDENEQPITNHSRIDELQVKVYPELVQVTGGIAVIKIPGNRSSWNTTMLEFNLPGHGLNVVNLADKSLKSDIDEYNLTMNFSEPVKISKTLKNKKQTLLDSLKRPDDFLGKASSKLH